MVVPELTSRVTPDIATGVVVAGVVAAALIVNTDVLLVTVPPPVTIPFVPFARVAVMFVVPATKPYAFPLSETALLIVAFVGVEEFQVTKDERSCVVLSEKFPVAVY